MPSRSFDARFGILLRSRGIAAIPASLFEHQADLQLSAQEMWLICALLSHRWDDRDPYPSLSRLAKRSGIPRTTIQTYLAQLRGKNLIDVLERHDAKGGRTSSAYSFEPLFDKLEQLILGTPLSHESAPPVDAYVSPLSIHASQSRYTQTDTDEAEGSPDAIPYRMLGHMVSLALRQPDNRDNVTQKLIDLQVTPEMVSNALLNWIKADGDAALWKLLGEK